MWTELQRFFSNERHQETFFFLSLPCLVRSKAHGQHQFFEMRVTVFAKKKKKTNNRLARNYLSWPENLRGCDRQAKEQCRVMSALCSKKGTGRGFFFAGNSLHLQCLYRFLEFTVTISLLMLGECAQGEARLAELCFGVSIRVQNGSVWNDCSLREQKPSLLKLRQKTKGLRHQWCS